MARYIDADLTDTEILNAVQEETADADTFITVRRILNKLPTADVATIIHAHWIKNKGYMLSRCSICQNTIPLGREYKHKYCPNCGARMDEKVE